MKYISIAVLSIFAGIMIACGSGGVQFAGAQDVVDAFDEFDLQLCTVKIAQMIGANSGLGCEVEGGSVEVYTFAGNAKAGCNNNEYCKILGTSDEFRLANIHNVYSGNVMLIVSGGVDLGNALIADLQE